MRAPRRSRRRGFTLAEVAMTIVIMGIGLVLVLQGLNTAKLTAAHTRNYKLARELALLTIGQVESGLFQDEIDEIGLSGSYADEGHPDFSYEIVVGDETFEQPTGDEAFDSWAPRDEDETDEEEDEETEEPFEKVKVKITFPKAQEFSNELVLERWIPWKQVYGESEEEDAPADGAATAAAGGASDGSGTPK